MSDDTNIGAKCSHCGVYFEEAHGHAVLCDDCFELDGGEGKACLPRTIHPEFGDDDEEDEE
jgi:hypothetical protein